MADPPPVLNPELAPVFCWRLVPAQTPKWQSGLLSHDPDLGDWSWEDLEREDAPREGRRAYWTPPLLDAHTHLGDAFLRPARDNLPRSIDALVAPPHGIKHKELARANEGQVREAITKRAREMVEKGTTATLDFREGGGAGLKTLLTATTDTRLEVQALARPAADPEDSAAWQEEAKELLSGPTLGLGLSGIRDLPKKRLEDAAQACRTHSKPLAFHLSEARHESVEEALRYDPRILVHLVHTKKAEWDELVEAHVLAVTCPTSNRFFGSKAPLRAMVEAHREHGLATAIGTDNAMLGDGDLRDEARLISEIVPDADLDWLLRSISWTPWRTLDLGPDPQNPGLLWGVHEKSPGSHPEETRLSKSQPLWNRPPIPAPHLGE